MKLRNKKTGEIKKMWKDNICLAFGDFNKVYYSLAELNEEWEDYKPSEKKPKRYQLVKDLPTFKAGEIFELWDSIECQGLYRESDDVMAYRKKTLDKFPNILGEWFEEIKPKEPLIKDEKIRKAVRAWAEADDLDNFRVQNEHFNECKIIGYSAGINKVSFICFQTTIAHAVNTKLYTIAELCGEEE